MIPGAVPERETVIGVRGVGLRVRTLGDTGAPTALVWAHAMLSSMAHEDASGVFDWSPVARRHLVVRYDARGHGGSAATEDPADYEWPSLAKDMLALADATDVERFVAGGVSMGAATALWAAIAAPRDRLAGLVLALPPAAWEDRAWRRRGYRVAGAAAALRLHLPVTLAAGRLPVWGAREGTPAAYLRSAPQHYGRVASSTMAAVLGGAARTDLPPAQLVSQVTCPVLVLAWTGDASHPVRVAERLAGLLPASDLHVARTDADVAGWPGLVGEFVDRVNGPIDAGRLRRR